LNYRLQGFWRWFADCFDDLFRQIRAIFRTPDVFLTNLLDGCRGCYFPFPIVRMTALLLWEWLLYYCENDCFIIVRMTALLLSEWLLYSCENDCFLIVIIQWKSWDLDISQHPPEVGTEVCGDLDFGYRGTHHAILWLFTR
jgi:hypothetical protein